MQLTPKMKWFSRWKMTTSFARTMAFRSQYLLGNPRVRFTLDMCRLLLLEKAGKFNIYLPTNWERVLGLFLSRFSHSNIFLKYSLIWKIPPKRSYLFVTVKYDAADVNGRKNLAFIENSRKYPPFSKISWIFSSIFLLFMENGGKKLCCFPETSGFLFCCSHLHHRSKGMAEVMN